MTEHAEMQARLAGGSRQRDRIVHKYRYLCRRGARKYARRGEDRDDFEQTAALGLIKAVDRYREDAGTPFEAYAWILIQGELSHYVRDGERMVRAPRRLRALERSWNDAREELCADLSREPSDREIAEHLLLDAEAVRDIHEYRERARIESLDASPFEEASRAYYTIEELDDRLMLEEALRTLTPLERSVLLESVARDRSVAEIAARLGYSERHVSRIRQSAIRKLGPLCVMSGAGDGY